MLLAAAYKSLLTSEDASGMVSGTWLPPQHFTGLSSNGGAMPQWKARVCGVPGNRMLEEPGVAPDGGHCSAPSILS